MVMQRGSGDRDTFRVGAAISVIILWVKLLAYLRNILLDFAVFVRGYETHRKQTPACPIHQLSPTLLALPVTQGVLRGPSIARLFGFAWNYLICLCPDVSYGS
jgi:hypothetical protein